MKQWCRGYYLGLLLILVSCSSEKEVNATPDTRVLKILALGDSYTKGESVCSTCNFPTQLRDSINARRGNGLSEVQIIAPNRLDHPATQKCN